MSKFQDVNQNVNAIFAGMIITQLFSVSYMNKIHQRKDFQCVTCGLIRKVKIHNEYCNVSMHVSMQRVARNE